MCCWNFDNKMCRTSHRNEISSCFVLGNMEYSQNMSLSLMLINLDTMFQFIANLQMH